MTEPKVTFVGTGLIDKDHGKHPHRLDPDTKGDPAQPPPVNGNKESLQAIVNAANNGVATAEDGWGGDAGKGLEGIDQAEFGQPPGLRILQSNSPEVSESEGKFIAGARPGMILNAGTQDVYDGKAGGIIIPVHRNHNYLVWRPRETGGGLVPDNSELDVTDPVILEMRKKQGAFGKLITSDGNEAVETFTLYCLWLSPEWKPGDDPARVFIAFTSTQIKKYNVLMQKLAGLIGRPPRYPLWAHRWHISTQPEKNKKGSFYGWRLGLEGGNAATALMNKNDPLCAVASEFYEFVKVGKLSADYGNAAPDTEGGEEIPF